MEEIMTGDVARMFNVHPRTVKRWCDAGRLEFHTNGYGWRFFHLRDIEAFRLMYRKGEYHGRKNRSYR